MININMTPEETKRFIKETIKDELRDFILAERYTFQKHVQFFDGRNVQTGRTVGTKIGTAKSPDFADSLMLAVAKGETRIVL